MADGIAVEQEIISKKGLVTERLDGTPHVVHDFDGDPAIIEFGNTGFKVILYVDAFDFLPEDKVLIIDEKNAAKYASMLAVSFLEVHKLLNDPEKLTEFGIGNKNLDEVSALTNDRLVNAIKGLFSRSKVPDLAYMNEEGYRIKVNLSRFKKLQDDDPLMIYLNRVSERAKDLDVTYEKAIAAPRPV